MRSGHTLTNRRNLRRRRELRYVHSRGRVVRNATLPVPSNRKIAESLHISEKTVGIHRGHIMQKLNVPSVAGLTKFAARQGLTTLNNR